MTSTVTQLRASEVKDVLLREIEKYEAELHVEEVGELLEVKDGVARIYGLTRAMANEMLEITASETGEAVVGLALNLEEDNIGAVILGDWSALHEGDVVRRTGRVLDVPVGEGLLGRVVNPLGEPLDGKGPISPVESRRQIDIVAPGIVVRQPVNQPLQTGLKSIDSMTPIGRGQRELIIGDRGTGKTALALDTIINQRGGDVICVYCAIGQRAGKVASVVDTLKQHGALDYTIVVMANASDPAPLQYIAPYAATAFAEEFMWQGKHTLVVHDDLSKHAQAYRQLSLVLRRPPGREAYPGDVFYLHSRLLERAAKLSDEEGGGSLTALPIVETQAGDVSAYIPTNVISITDGQIYLESDLFYAGVRPAVNVGISVSRVGGAAQVKAMKSIAGRLRVDLAQFRELEAFSQFAAELDQATQRQLGRGERTVEILKQRQYEPMSVQSQVMIIYAVTNGHLDDVALEKVDEWGRQFQEFMGDRFPEIGEAILTGGEMTDEIKSDLEEAIKEFRAVVAARAATEIEGGEDQKPAGEEAEEGQPAGEEAKDQESAGDEAEDGQPASDEVEEGQSPGDEAEEGQPAGEEAEDQKPATSSGK